MFWLINRWFQLQTFMFVTTLRNFFPLNFPPMWFCTYLEMRFSTLNLLRLEETNIHAENFQQCPLPSSCPCKQSNDAFIFCVFSAKHNERVHEWDRGQSGHSEPQQVCFCFGSHDSYLLRNILALETHIFFQFSYTSSTIQLGNSLLILVLV